MNCAADRMDAARNKKSLNEHTMDFAESTKMSAERRMECAGKNITFAEHTMTSAERKMMLFRTGCQE
jgi:hypothetical protein